MYYRGLKGVIDSEVDSKEKVWDRFSEFRSVACGLTLSCDATTVVGVDMIRGTL